MDDIKVDENFYLQPVGELRGHNGWVTCLATTFEAQDVLLSGSRDKTIIKWRLTRTQDQYGVPERRMKGHGHYVEDIAISSDGQFALSGSWDGTLRLWDLQTGVTTCRFVGHSKDVLSVAFSPGNRQIVSGSRDHGVELWNTLGVNKVHLSDKNNGGHTDWVSCVRFSPNTNKPLIVSASWDKTVKVWDLEKFELKNTLRGHTGYVNAVTVSPDGSLCASGGKDGFAKLWDVNEGKCLHNLEAKDVIHQLVFSPSRYWLCAATASAIKVFNLETKNCIETVKLEEDPESKRLPTQCISLAWSPDGNTLFAGYTDGVIRVYAVSK